MEGAELMGISADPTTTSPLQGHLEESFRVKTSCDVDGTMAYFSTDLATYTDATLGWDIDSWDALQAIFAQYMPNWGPLARSYSTAILSNETSALIRMVDTPELFGGELRILAAVDLADGAIIRWVDYWDGAPFDEDLYGQLRTPAEAFPTDLKDDVVATQASPSLVAVATELHAAFASNDASAGEALLHPDVVVEDMALRAQVVGRIETTAYLARVLGDVPYGAASRLRHVVGGDHGGAFEWTAGPAHDGLVGITAIELDADRLVTRITSVYDTSQVPADLKARLVGAVVA